MKNKSTYLLYLFIISIALVLCNRLPRDFSEAMLESFQGHRGFYHIKLPPSLLQAVFKGEQTDQSISFLKDLKQVGVMSVGSTDLDEMARIEVEVNKWLDYFHYNDLFMVAEGGRKVSFKLMEKDGMVEEMMAVIKERESLMVISLHGRLDMSQVMSLSQQINPEVFPRLLQGNFSKE